MSKKLEKSPEFSVFFNNLIDVCNNFNTNPTSIAKQFSNSSVLTAWKNGKVEVSVVSEICKNFNVSADFLFGLDKKNLEKPLTESQKAILDEFNKLNIENQVRISERIKTLLEMQQNNKLTTPDNNIKTINYVPMISIRHSVYKVSAGRGYDLDSGDQWDKIEVVDTPKARSADFCLTIDGDSMEPIYHNGDIVLIKAQPAIDNGEIGIFTIENAGYIKKYGGDRLISLNANYDDIMFSDYTPDSIRCIGLVIGRG